MSLTIHCIGCGKASPNSEITLKNNFPPMCKDCAQRPEVRGYVEGLRRRNPGQYYHREELESSRVIEVGFQTVRELFVFLQMTGHFPGYECISLEQPAEENILSDLPKPDYEGPVE